MSFKRAPEVAAVDRTVCDACGLCMPLCPTQAIELHRDGLLILEPRCTGCRKCINPCPVHALTMVAPSAVLPMIPVPLLA